MIILTLDIIVILLIIIIAILFAHMSMQTSRDSRDSRDSRITGSGQPRNLTRTDLQYTQPLTKILESDNVVMHVPHESTKSRWSELADDGYYVAREPDVATYLPGSKYLGSVSGNRKNNGKYYIWQKVPKEIPGMSGTPVSPLVSPPVRIEEHEGFKVIRDDFLLGGTKQRGAVPLLGILPEKEFIYVGPYTGFAQIALALAAKLNGKIATLFIQKHRPMSYQTKMALQLGAQVYEFNPPNSTLAAMRKRAETYKANSSKPEDIRMFMLGFQEQEFKDELGKALREAVAGTELADPNFTGTIWVTGGSATLAQLFYTVFPKAKINVVQIGKAIDWYIDPKRSDFYIAPEKFYDPAEIPPPYKSVPEYDAKLWRFVKEHGKPGDYVWNVAGSE